MNLPDLTIDPDNSVPVYRQIADGVVNAVRAGRLTPGSRLPPTRDLARKLGINRQTVVAAYEFLADRGWVHSHTGKGTFVAEAAGEAPGSSGAEVDGWVHPFSRAVEGPGVGGLLSLYRTANEAGGISFAGSYPARDLLPVAAFGRALEATLIERGHEVLAYGPTAGYAPLRAVLADVLRAEGSVVDADDILITNGAQQAIELVFHAFLERGDPVVVEEPTYTGAHSVLGSLGARVVGVPVDGEGIRPDALAPALERHRPRLIYVQPTFHNPTTAVMGEARRREVLALAVRNRCIVVEDDWAGGLRFAGEPSRTLHALDGGRNVIYLSTFSKKLLPGLRVGWIAAPRPAIERLTALKQIRDCGTSPLLQAALHAFLREGGLDAHLRSVLPAYRTRRDCMLAALERELPRGARWTRPQGGLFVWVTLPRGFDGAGLFRAAEQRGVLYSAGEVFHGNSDGRHTLRLTYSAASPEQIESGIAILGELVRERWPDRDDAESLRRTESVPIL